MADEQDVCPHCGAIRDVLRAVEEDEASPGSARPHRANLPAVPATKG